MFFHKWDRKYHLDLEHVTTQTSQLANNPTNQQSQSSFEKPITKIDVDL